MGLAKHYLRELAVQKERVAITTYSMHSITKAVETMPVAGMGSIRVRWASRRPLALEINTYVCVAMLWLLLHRQECSMEK